MRREMQNAPGLKASGRFSVDAGTRNHLNRTFLGSERKDDMHPQLSRFMDHENTGQPCTTFREYGRFGASLF
jgi:hypothetical protein